MKAIYLLLILAATTTFAKAQQKTIFRYGEEVPVRPDTLTEARKLAATANSNQVYLNWVVYNSRKAGMYVIERAVDGKDFEVIALKKGIATSIPLELAFYYTDKEPVAGKAVYKVTHIADDNTYFEFAPVTVKGTKSDALTAVLVAEVY